MKKPNCNICKHQDTMNPTIDPREAQCAVQDFKYTKYVYNTKKCKYYFIDKTEVRHEM